MIQRVYDIYKTEIFPKIQHIRGTTRLKKILRKTAYGKLERVEEEQEGIFEKEEWDNLIILDALRYDKYQDQKDYSVPYRISKGSMTREYVEKNFSEGNFEDVIYVTANGWITKPMLPKLIDKENPFHTIYDTIIEKWNDEIGAVHPEDLVEDAISAQKLFPEKKIIIHFGQPHLPFIHNQLGDTRTGPLSDREGESEFDLAKKGEIPQEDIIKGYEKNLEIVLDYVEELASQLNGKTILTADHGELLGENDLYGHPYGKDYKLLKKVPWDVLKER